MTQAFTDTLTRGDGARNRDGRVADLNRTFGDHPDERLPSTRVTGSAPRNYETRYSV